jgi:predicted kinase
MECAQSGLQAGFNVIVDASFLDPADRDLFTSLASRMNVSCAFIACHADPATLLNRVAARTERGEDVSEADQSVVRSQLGNYVPLETKQQPVIEIDTRDPDAVEKVIHAVRKNFAR